MGGGRESRRGSVMQGNVRGEEIGGEKYFGVDREVRVGVDREGKGGGRERLGIRERNNRCGEEGEGDKEE